MILYLKDNTDTDYWYQLCGARSTLFLMPGIWGISGICPGIGYYSNVTHVRSSSYSGIRCYIAIYTYDYYNIFCSPYIKNVATLWMQPYFWWTV